MTHKQLKRMIWELSQEISLVRSKGKHNFYGSSFKPPVGYHGSGKDLILVLYNKDNEILVEGSLVFGRGHKNLQWSSYRTLDKDKVVAARGTTCKFELFSFINDVKQSL